VTIESTDFPENVNIWKYCPYNALLDLWVCVSDQGNLMKGEGSACIKNCFGVIDKQESLSIIML
jgi:hypothetical protein